MRLPGMLQHMRNRAVDLCIPAATFLVMQLSGIAHAGQYQTMLDVRNLVLVPCEPGNRADRSRNEQETVRITVRRDCQRARQRSCKDDSRQIVVAQGWVAGVAGDQHFAPNLSWQKVLAISQMAVFQSRVNTNFIFSIFQRRKLPLRNAKSPVLFVVGSPVWNPIGMRWKREQMVFQLRKWHPTIHRHAVIHHVQIRFLEIYDTLALSVLHVSVANIPFLRHRPIEYPHAGGNLAQLEPNLLLEPTKSLAKPVPCDAAANGIEFRDQAEHRLALGQGIQSVLECACVQDLCAILTQQSLDNSGLSQ